MSEQKDPAMGTDPRKDEAAQSVVLSQERRAEIKAALDKVDNYHPVFGLEQEFVEFSERNVSRLCQDRCVFLETCFDERDISQIRILDVGCSMGYISLFFARKGARVYGIDSNPNQVFFCRTLAKHHGILATFKNADFSEGFCSGISEGDFDVVFLFSVLHHVVRRYGVGSTRAMMKLLLEAADVLYVELAQKSEDVPFDWKEALPENDLEIFGDIPGLNVERLGSFAALNGGVIRPMYKVWLDKKTFNGVAHSPLEVRHPRVEGESRPHRKYYLGAGVFTKVFCFDDPENVAWENYCSESSVYDKFSGRPEIPALLGYEVRGQCGFITVERVEGPTLMDQIINGEISNFAAVAEQIVGILRLFDEHGLFWNDFRSHNIIVRGESLVAHDFEFVSPIERENTLNLLLWLFLRFAIGPINDAFVQRIPV